jgi:hypothetical protein
MVRRLCAAFLVLAATACGARSELRDADADTDAACRPLNIGILGEPGWYSSSDFDPWLLLSGAGVQRIQTTPGEPVTEATLQPFDVVVLDWLVRDYTASEAATFAAWLAAGGGAASMSGYNGHPVDDWHANSLLAPLEIAYAGPLISGPVTDLATHPITAGITSVVFEGGYAISDLGGHASARTPIASLPAAGGDVNVGYAIQMGTGRAFVWGDEWIEFTSNEAIFPPKLWVQMFAWISPPNACTLTPPI